MKSAFRLSAAVLAALTALGSAHAQSTAASAAPPAHPAGIVAAPAHLRAYFDAAKRADALPGKEERCRAFADLPGNRWPAGLVDAWCTERRLISLDDVAAHLERGDLAGLETAYKRHLERHFSETDFNELIHNDFMYFDGSQRAGELSARWLAAASGSAYANAARGAHLLAAAWDARGGAFMQDTPAENVRKMRELAKQAREYMGKALSIEPRLLPMHEELVELAMLTNQDELAEAAYQRGAALDPGCRWLTQSWMRTLRPKWGGSIEAMARYADTLKPMLPKRPLLASTIVMPQIERADALFENEQYRQVVELLKPAALVSNYQEVHALLGRAIGYLPKHDPFEALMYLLQASRFVDDNFTVERELARVLLNVQESAWALRAGQRALALKPDDPVASQYVGMAHVNLQQYAQSEAPLLAALKHEETRGQALELLISAMGYDKQFAKSERYAEQLTREQPDNGHGWYTLGMARIRQGKDDAALPALETYLKVADRADPRHALMVAEVEAGLSKFKKYRATIDASERKQR